MFNNVLSFGQMASSSQNRIGFPAEPAACQDGKGTSSRAEINFKSEFRKIFLDESVRIFGMSMNEAFALWNEILRIAQEDSCDAQIISYVEGRFRNYECIPLVVPEQKAKTFVSPIGYFVIVSLLYYRYRTRTEYTQIQCVIDECPFLRVLIDCDVDANVDLIAYVKQLLAEQDITEVTVTRRVGRETQSFHVISKMQFDNTTAKSIVIRTALRFPNNLGGHIDNTSMWALPSGRCHSVDNTADMCWNTFKSLSPVDVWNSDNFKTRIVNYCLTPENYNMMAYTDKGDYFNFILESTQTKNFFERFSNYVEFKFKFDNTIKISIALKTLLGFVCNTSKARKNNDNDDIQIENSDDEEFFTSYYETKIKYKTPLKVIMDISPEYVNKGSIITTLKDDLRTYVEKAATIDAFQEYRQHMRRNVEYMFTPQEQHKYDVLREFATNDVELDKCIKKIIEHMEAECKNHVLTCLYMYYIWWRRHPEEDCQLTLECFCRVVTRLRDRGSLSIVERNIKKICPNFVLDETDTDDSVIEVAVFKHIFKTMLDCGYVSSLLSLVLRSNIYKINALACSIVLLMSLGSTNSKSQYILLSYISSFIEPYMSSITETLVESFTRSDVLHFLCDFFDQSVIEMRDEWAVSFAPFIALCPDDSVDNEAPRSKKRVKHSNSMPQITLCEIFNKQVLFLSMNSCLYYVYWKRQYRLFNPDKTHLKIVHLPFAFSLAVEPSHFANWYRRDIGIYFSITQEYEHHSPALFSMINIRTPEKFKKHGFALYNNKDNELKCFALDTFLKAKHFISICQYNKYLIVMLAPIHQLNRACEYTGFEHQVNCIQITTLDLNESNLEMPPSIQSEIQNYPLLYNTSKYVYAILCTLSHRGRINLHSPATLLDMMFLSWPSNIRGSKEKLEHVYTASNSNTKNLPKTPCDVETNFILKIREACKQWRRSQAKETISPTTGPASTPLTQTTFDHTSLDTLNFFFTNEAFNGFIPTGFIFDTLQVSPQLFQFIFSIMSWFIRMGDSHDQKYLTFFKYLAPIKHQLYREMCDLLLSTCGAPMHHKDLRQLCQYFTNFCENTELYIPEKYDAMLPTGYKFNATHYNGDFKNDIYMGIAGMILHSQFNSDTFIDILKLLSSFTHRGNISRQVMVLLNRTSTGKNVLIGFLLKTLFPTERNEFTKDELENCEKEAGNNLAQPMNSNLLVWFDEVAKLDGTFKLLANFSILHERAFYQQERASLRINSHIIMSANADPSCLDTATLSRILPIDRTLQFVEMRINQQFNRQDAVDGVFKTINDILGVQLLLEYLPVGGQLEQDALGLFLFTWLCSDIFLFTFALPASLKKSKTMTNRMHRFLYSSRPSQYLIDNKLIVYSINDPMEMVDFDNMALEKMKELKPLLSSNFNASIAVRELRDLLSKFIFNEKIYVKFV